MLDIHCRPWTSIPDPGTFVLVFGAIVPALGCECIDSECLYQFLDSLQEVPVFLGVLEVRRLVKIGEIAEMGSPGE